MTLLGWKKKQTLSDIHSNSLSCAGGLPPPHMRYWNNDFQFWRCMIKGQICPLQQEASWREWFGVKYDQQTKSPVVHSELWKLFLTSYYRLLGFSTCAKCIFSTSNDLHEEWRFKLVLDSIACFLTEATQWNFCIWGYKRLSFLALITFDGTDVKSKICREDINYINCWTVSRS